MGYELKYPHIPLLRSLRPSPRILLGKRLHWTIKEDGECITIWENEKVNGEKFIQISSRNQIDASSDIRNKVMSSDDYPKILKLLEDYPQFACYVEECKKGISVTNVKVYDRAYLFLFDIYDRSAEKFLTYVNVYQHAFHYGIPCVRLWAETRHTSMKDLLKWSNDALKYCNEIREEGIVIKTFDKNFGYVQVKVKIDAPKPLKRKIKKGAPIYPPIPPNEIFGAINKAHQDLGNDDFMKTELAMPLIARYVSEECKKHQYSKPVHKLFGFYKEYQERMMSE